MLNAACTPGRPCWSSVHFACPFCMPMLHFYASCSCSIATSPYCMPMLHTRPMLHVCVSMLHIYTACPRCKSLHAWKCRVNVNMNMNTNANTNTNKNWNVHGHEHGHKSCQGYGRGHGYGHKQELVHGHEHGQGHGHGQQNFAYLATFSEIWLNFTKISFLTIGS